MASPLSKTTTQLVKKILKSSEKSRDNDRYIQCAIWFNEVKTLSLTSSSDFINAYFKGRLTDPNGVSRVRRKLQDLYPELRGTKYESRQEDYQEDAKEKIKKIK